MRRYGLYSVDFFRSQPEVSRPQFKAELHSASPDRRDRERNRFVGKRIRIVLGQRNELDPRPGEPGKNLAAKGGIRQRFVHIGDKVGQRVVGRSIGLRYRNGYRCSAVDRHVESSVLRQPPLLRPFKQLKQRRRATCNAGDRILDVGAEFRVQRPAQRCIDADDSEECRAGDAASRRLQVDRAPHLRVADEEALIETGLADLATEDQRRIAVVGLICCADILRAEKTEADERAGAVDRFDPEGIDPTQRRIVLEFQPIEVGIQVCDDTVARSLVVDEIDQALDSRIRSESVQGNVVRRAGARVDHEVVVIGSGGARRQTKLGYRNEPGGNRVVGNHREFSGGIRG